MNQTINCDFQVNGESCGKVAVGQAFDGNIATVSYHMDLCAKHQREVQQALVTLGARPAAISVGRKRRAPHVAKSGRVFSTAEARVWLVRNGYIEPDAKGRVAQEHLNLYGDNH